jgi:hypothetical protein
MKDDLASAAGAACPFDANASMGLQHAFSSEARIAAIECAVAGQHTIANRLGERFRPTIRLDRAAAEKPVAYGFRGDEVVRDYAPE